LFYSKAFIYRPFSDVALDPNSSKAVVAIHPIYLLPEIRYRGEIFEEQLDGWHLVPSAWPVDRTFDTFIRWFECSFHSVLVDLFNDPLMREET